MTLPLARRTLLASAGLALLTDVTHGQNPGEQVVDRTSSIKITRMTPIPAGSKVYVKIETNYDVTGWGEITGLEPTVAAALITSLFELLDGQNPTRIEYLWQRIYRANRNLRGGPFMVHCLSAIDMALWDITGKLWGVPIYRLLGGPVRDKIRMYPHEKAFKMAPGGPQPFGFEPKQILGLVHRLTQYREKVGPDGVLILDAHCSVPPPALIQLAAALEPLNLMFIEEPAVPGNIEVFKRLKEQIRIPLASGERDRTIWEMLPYLQHGCLDVLQPDCGHTGGISQMRKIATLAEAYQVPLAPHCTMSTIGLTASLHATAATPLFLIHEGYLQYGDVGEGVTQRNWEQSKDGYASLPEGPGLGIEVNEKALAAVPPKPFNWPKNFLRDGSPADY